MPVNRVVYQDGNVWNGAAVNDLQNRLADKVDPLEVVAGDHLQPGVIASGHCALTRDSASQVTIAAGVVWVTNASGLLVRATPVSTVLSGIPVAVNNRIDQIVITSAGVVSRLQGTTDVAGNTLAANPQAGGGRAVVPAGSKLLHDIEVTSSGVLAVNCRDRRSWARGALSRKTRTAGNVTTLSTALVAISPADLSTRVECSGRPLRIRLTGIAFVSTSGVGFLFGCLLDGAAIDGTGDIGQAIYIEAAPLDYTTIPAPGSHVIVPTWRTSAGYTLTLLATAGSPAQLIVEELRPSASNGS